MPDAGNTVRDAPERDRYELDTPAGPAVVEYERDGDVLVLAHTIVPEEARGGGVAARLVKGALDDVRARGLRIVPQCAYVARFLERHAEYRDLVARP